MTALTKPVRPPPLRPIIICDGCGKRLGTTAEPLPHPWYDCPQAMALIALGITVPVCFFIYFISSPLGRQIIQLLRS